MNLSKKMEFSIVEFGAVHSYGRNIWDILDKVRYYFSDLIFNVHTFFFPLKERFLLFNPVQGLSSINKTVIDNLILKSSMYDSCTCNEIIKLKSFE